MRALCYTLFLLFIAPFAALVISAAVSQDMAEWTRHAVELKSVMRSIATGLTAALFTSLMGATLAFAVSFNRFPLKKVIEKLLVLPLLVPTFVLGTVYKEMFSASGWLVTRMGLPTWLTADFQSSSGFVFVMVFGLFPYVYLLCRLVFEALGDAFFDLGRSIQLTPMRSFKRVLLPLALPAVLLGATLVFVETSGTWATASRLSVRTSAFTVHELWLARGEPELATGLAFLFVVIALIALVILGRVRGAGRGRYLPVAPPSRPEGKGELEGGWRGWLLTGCCLLPGIIGPGIIGFLLPAAVLGHFCCQTIGTIDLSLLVSNAIDTLCLIAAVLAISVAFAIVLSAAHRAARGSVTGHMVRWLVVSYTIPGSVLAIGVLVLVGHTPLSAERTSDLFAFWLLALTLSIRFIMFLVVPLLTGLNLSAREMADTGASLGLSRIQTLVRLHLPHIKRFAWLGVLLLVLSTLKETDISVALSPFGFQTLTLKSYAYIEIDLLPESATWVITTMLLGLWPLITIERILTGWHASK
jgi:iron(III) transport system permease protein